MIRGRASLLLAMLLAMGIARVDAAEIPPDKRALILMRVLAYDRNLAGRSGEVVRVAVLYRAGDARSEQAAGELVGAAGSAQRSVAGKPVQLVSVAFAADTLERDLARAGASAVYVSSGLSGVTSQISDVTQRRKALSLSSEEELVQSGLAIGLVRRGDRAVILVNLVAARAEGADLSADLLRLAEVVAR